MRLYEFDMQLQQNIEATLMTLLQYFLPKSGEEEVTIPVDTILNSMQSISPGFSKNDLDMFKKNNSNISSLIKDITDDSVVLSPSDDTATDDNFDSDIDGFDDSGDSLNDVNFDDEAFDDVEDLDMADGENDSNGFKSPFSDDTSNDDNSFDEGPQPLEMDPAAVDGNIDTVTKMADRATKRRT